ncbi:DUF1772 domain-containing protein [Streptosporangium sp. KLBMP 9127]|nr:DUF1772 domain-containing protein [Streptosporangium sp. KLBMP 9127]
MISQTLSIPALIGSGIVAGVLFAVALNTVPALMSMSPDMYIRSHQSLQRNWDPTMPVIVLASAATDLGLVVVVERSPGRGLFAMAAVCLIGVAIVSHLCNVPINRRVRRLDPDFIPADWLDPRPAWRGWHLLRTALALIALALNSVAVTLT